MRIITAKNGDSFVVFAEAKSGQPFLRYANKQQETLEVLVRKGQKFPKEWEPYINPSSPQSLVVCFAYLPLKLLDAYVQEIG